MHHHRHRHRNEVMRKCVRCKCLESRHQWPTDRTWLKPSGTEPGLRAVLVWPFPLGVQHEQCLEPGCGCPGFVAKGTPEASDFHPGGRAGAAAEEPIDPHSWKANPPPPPRKYLRAWDVDPEAALPGAPDRTHVQG